MTITPKQAQELLEGTTPGPWVYNSGLESIETSNGSHTVLCNTNDVLIWGANPDLDAPLAAQAPIMAEQIAGMAYEYAAQVQLTDDGPWKYLTSREGIYTDLPYLAAWKADIDSAQRMLSRTTGQRNRIVRRLVGEPEAID